MKKVYPMLFIGAALGCLIGCSSNQATPDDVAQGLSYSPCQLPSELPTTAMGQLGIRFIRLGDNIRIIIPSDNVFEIRSSILQDNAYPGLTELANVLSPYRGLPLTITGYTDELGTSAEDRDLSLDQARRIQTFLWTHGYCHPSLNPKGMGKTEAGQVASNRSPLGSMRNRRVEITLRAQSGLMDNIKSINTLW